MKYMIDNIWYNIQGRVDIIYVYIKIYSWWHYRIYGRVHNRIHDKLNDKVHSKVYSRQDNKSYIIN